MLDRKVGECRLLVGQGVPDCDVRRHYHIERIGIHTGSLDFRGILHKGEMNFASLRDIDCKILCDKSSGDYADSRLLGRLAHEYRVVQGIENLVRSNRIVPCQQPELVSLHTVLGQGLVGSLHRHGRGDDVIVICTEGHFEFCGIGKKFQLVLARLRIGGVLE